MTEDRPLTDLSRLATLLSRSAYGFLDVGLIFPCLLFGGA